MVRQRDNALHCLSIAAIALLITFANPISAARPFSHYDTKLYSTSSSHLAIHSSDLPSTQEATPTPSTTAAADNKKEKELNLRPLIGILSQGGEPAPSGSSYIAASYIKFVEAAGARAVPILHDMSRQEVTRRFNAVNGVLLPGGSQDLHAGNPYFDTAALLFDLTLAANDDGTYFPLFGTCLGFETLAILAAKNESVVTNFDAEDYPEALYPTEKAEKSNFFTALPPHVAKNLFTKKYAMENHAHGVAYDAFASNPGLDAFFDVLTLSVDRQDAIYISTIEAKNYPITGFQYHPEKNAFEWTLEKHIPHHPDAIEVTQEIANYVVSEARKNFHAPADRDDEEDLLIYNWNRGLEYSGTRKFVGEEVDFDEIYVFPDAATFLSKTATKKE